MNSKERLETIERFLENECFPLLEAKGHDYTQGNAEVNDNFKRIAITLQGRGIDKYDVWAIYFQKHIDALTTWLNKRQMESSESLGSRIADLVNYLLILHTMLEEDRRLEHAARTANILVSTSTRSPLAICYKDAATTGPTTVKTTDYCSS